MEKQLGTVVLAGMNREEAAGACGFGSGKPWHGFAASLRRSLEELYGMGYRSFACVVCEGFNLLAADAVAGMKERLDASIRLKAVLPHPALARELDPLSLLYYREVMRRADYTKVFSDYPTGRCRRAAAEYLLSECALLVCWWNGRAGDTSHIVSRARELKIPVRNLYVFESPAEG